MSLLSLNVILLSNSATCVLFLLLLSSSLLCRQLEKLIVRTDLLPIFDDPRFFDQYAYKITVALLELEMPVQYNVTFDLDLDLEHTLDAGSPGDHRLQVWSQSTLWLREKAILGRAQKCPYHVTFDLDLDLEHTLDAGLPVDHRVQVL